MKRLFAVAALCVAVGAQAGTVDFTGAYAPGNWTQTVAGNGSISTSSASVSLTSPDNLALGGTTDLTITIAPGDTGALMFDWAFTTQDDPFWERFGYLLNGLFTQLTDEFGPQQQSGTATVFVSAGDTFGFREWALDDFGGPSTTRIGNFATAVPEPGALALAALALAAAAAARRSRRKV